MSGNAPVYKSGNAQTTAASTKNSSGIGPSCNPADEMVFPICFRSVVGGGIRSQLHFLIDGLLVDMNSLDAAARSNFKVRLPPAAAMFNRSRRRGIRLHAPGSCRLSRHGIGIASTARGFCRRYDDGIPSGTSVSLEHSLPVFAASYIILVLPQSM